MTTLPPSFQRILDILLSFLDDLLSKDQEIPKKTKEKWLKVSTFLKKDTPNPINLQNFLSNLNENMSKSKEALHINLPYTKNSDSFKRKTNLEFNRTQPNFFKPENFQNPKSYQLENSHNIDDPMLINFDNDDEENTNDKKTFYTYHNNFMSMKEENSNKKNAVSKIGNISNNDFQNNVGFSRREESSKTTYTLQNDDNFGLLKEERNYKNNAAKNNFGSLKEESSNYNKTLSEIYNNKNNSGKSQSEEFSKVIHIHPIKNDFISLKEEHSNKNSPIKYEYKSEKNSSTLKNSQQKNEYYSENNSSNLNLDSPFQIKLNREQIEAHQKNLETKNEELSHRKTFRNYQTNFHSLKEEKLLTEGNHDQNKNPSNGNPTTSSYSHLQISTQNNSGTLKNQSIPSIPNNKEKQYTSSNMTFKTLESPNSRNRLENTSKITFKTLDSPCLIKAQSEQIQQKNSIGIPNETSIYRRQTTEKNPSIFNKNLKFRSNTQKKEKFIFGEAIKLQVKETIALFENNNEKLQNVLQMCHSTLSPKEKNKVYRELSSFPSSNKQEFCVI